jgi:sn-glycerol 3-phosphate transport system ATP-binding protein
MANLVVRNLTRVFPSGGGVRDVSLSVGSGEFLVLLGPSGCGKSTLLRLIAGLEQPDSGDIEIGGVARSRNEDHRDAVAMVFQNFALYPHMSVFQNIAFPLRLRRVPRDEMTRRVQESARKAGLDFDLGRYPAELSGGQRQRVALARALVREPAIVLMDEPLASLDAQLRSSLRVELKDFQRRTGRTVVYVTHDQVEALALADRLAVMRSGAIEQIGRPEELFDRPQTEFVAGFLGDPPMNLFRAEVQPRGEGLVARGVHIDARAPQGAPAIVTVGIRPGDLMLKPDEGSIQLDAIIENVEFSGAAFVLYLKVGDIAMRARIAERLEPGKPVKLFFSPTRLHFFDPSTGNRVG